MSCVCTVILGCLLVVVVYWPRAVSETAKKSCESSLNAMRCPAQGDNTHISALEEVGVSCL